MSDRPSNNLAGMDIQTARRIDEVCRCFEADWRSGLTPRIEDYLGGFTEEAQPALRAELEAIERELNEGEANRQIPVAQAAAPPSSIAEAPTIAPGSIPTLPKPGEASSSVHEHATVPPRGDATVDLGSSAPASSEAGTPSHVRYFGDYEIIREIARGGMGVVFEARQVSLNRKVALKMILAGQLANETDVKRFYTEAEAAANLDHPGIVPIFEIGQHEGQHYFSMGFVEGQSLAHRLAEGPLPTREAAELTRRVAEAVEYAHQRGVIHRDLKPANVLLDREGRPRVTDFGLAKKVQTDSGLTGSGQIMGTPSYMPPEQTGGKRGEVGPAADVYALGATLYALVTGRPPFQAATAMDTVIQVISEQPVPPRRLDPTIPRDLETVCLKCLEKAPGDRYPSAAALADELGRFLDYRPILARPIGGPERFWRWCRRRPVVAGLGAAVAALVLFMAVAGPLIAVSQSRLRKQSEDRENEAITAMGAAVAARQAEQDRRREAEQSQRDAKLARAGEEQQTELASRRHYDAQISQLQRYWDEYNGTLLKRGLDEQLPGTQSGVDFRGFEWFYWQRRMASAHIALPQGQAVWSVAFSPDGTRVAAADSSGKLKVWDVAQRRTTSSLNAHTGEIRGVAFSPDGRHLATAGVDRSVKLWEVVSGRCVHTLVGHTNVVYGVAFSPDSKRLASAGGDSTVKVWDVGSGQELRTLTGHRNGVLSVVFSRDGRRLASGSWDKTLRLWDAETWQKLRTIDSPNNMIHCVVFSPDGRRLASSGMAEKVTVWDAATGRDLVTLTGHAGAVWSVTFRPDGRRLASCGMDQTVREWDAATGQEVRRLKGHTDGLWSVAYDNAGRRLASAGMDGAVRLWDAEASQEPLSFRPEDAGIQDVAFTPDSRRILAADGQGSVKARDAGSGEEVRTLKDRGDIPFAAVLSPDGRQFAIRTSKPLGAGGYLELQVFDAQSAKRTLSLDADFTGSTPVLWSADGGRLVTANGEIVRVWDARSGEQLRLFQRGGPSRLACSPDGRRIVAGYGADGWMWVEDAADGQHASKWQGHSEMVMAVAFSPDGQRFASASCDRTAKVWDTTSGKPVLALTLMGHTASVESVVFSPDGRRLASSGQDQTVKVWDAATGQETLTLAITGPSAAGRKVVFSPDGRRLACVTTGGMVTIWDARPLETEPARPATTPR
jgi:WD40 repeat protein